jgi:RNA polymerase sigma-70 factor (ECF subfamily)
MGADIRPELVGELSRPGKKGVAITSAYLGICGSDELKHVENRQRIIELYDRLRPSLYAYLCALGLAHHHSEDVIQETFLRLVRHIVEQGADENLRAWVFRVAHNLSMDFHRSERRWFRDNETEPHPVLRDRVDPAPNPEQKIIQGERTRQFEIAFAQLTPKQRHCVLLRAEGLRYREIALALGVSVQRVGELMQRAISLLEVDA